MAVKWIVNKALSSGEAESKDFPSYREAVAWFREVADSEMDNPNGKPCKVAQITLSKMVDCNSCGEQHLTQVLRFDARRADV